MRQQFEEDLRTAFRSYEEQEAVEEFRELVNERLGGF